MTGGKSRDDKGETLGMTGGNGSGRQGGVSLDDKREWLGMTGGETLCHNELEKKLLTKILRKMLKMKILFVYLQPAKMCGGI